VKLLTKYPGNSCQNSNFIPLFDVLKDNNYYTALLFKVWAMRNWPRKIIIWHKDCFSTEYFTFVFNLIYSDMKKIAVILIVCFITAVFISSCNDKACPAYTKAPAEQAERNV